MGLGMFKSPFECLCGYFILPEFFEHVYLFALFLFCEKYYTLSCDLVKMQVFQHKIRYFVVRLTILEYAGNTRHNVIQEITQRNLCFYKHRHKLKILP